MKTFELASSDGHKYTILIKNISCLSTDKSNGGTWVELNSGTRIHTNIEVDTLTKMINGED